MGANKKKLSFCFDVQMEFQRLTPAQQGYLFH